ncbi:MAG: ATP synthase F0 subunit B [Candidatus Sungbacteria bacterium RIFCSPLOWO2_02_FULL_47_9]|uniref:ATP synthase subunit b n=1 Tax=Candidatus Sungbacteria bacterium RIFCSPHIGHO2_01_FULL_47_32 TaxID=1802264 RepID=A0A1G2K6J6_9BACT|nr:MAG: ATP synthase subunit b [Parcubacteria group bacterium GW2011_GWA2_47_10]OGZ95069.1 MAG: ATP synthase F0 subunit B [Candidatus Sungbacteria bacterium RIFCSPHIGHO2_01_FULL_47_32]OHA06121.1 MAG: ATP synthase F0 subunit B [Candidatus Sungbacteria bacterium RIFCSPLOWO2_01_FULL_47_32]OHA10286.1 MAG: ATP synthase F0 subunit B [Candidatus Sungbacteria bacterium RIFCSPLOWO2_02_FULL_47_9]
MSELLQHFGIEWKLLLAQLVNFGVLFFVLRKFAYGPLLGMLRERREKIAEGMRAAEESQQKLAEANREKDALLGEARKESVSLIQKSETGAKEKEILILAQAQKKADGILAEEKAKIQEERLKMKEEFRRESAEFVKRVVAEVVLRSPESLDENLITGVVQELKNT